MMQQPELGKKIADRRKELGFTQEELAEKCQITVRSIQRIEAGKVNPRRSSLKILIEILDFEKGVFLKEKVEKLRDFYEHLVVFLIVNFFIYLRNILDSSEAFELHSISIIWGIIIFLQAAEVFFEIIFGPHWEKNKINKLMSKTNVYSYLKSKIFFKPAVSRFHAIFFSGILIGIVLIWYLFIGYHNHQVIINRGAISLNIKSTDSRFEFSVSDKHAQLLNEYAINDYNFTSKMGKPFNINGHGIISSTQIINLPDSISLYRFAINETVFVLDNNNLYQETNMWYLQPNKPVILDADLFD